MTDRLDQAVEAGEAACKAEFARADEAGMHAPQAIASANRARAKAIIESWEASGEAINTIRQRAGLEE